MTQVGSSRWFFTGQTYRWKKPLGRNITLLGHTVCMSYDCLRYRFLESFCLLYSGSGPTNRSPRGQWTIARGNMTTKTSAVKLWLMYICLNTTRTQDWRFDSYDVTDLGTINWWFVCVSSSFIHLCKWNPLERNVLSSIWYMWFSRTGVPDSCSYSIQNSVSLSV